jgi:biotin carboxyl carrier protein
MKEQNVKKRGWVKNAIIAFLIVMLVLTFFSNTIMNRSLPEVAVQYASSGTITARIRGSGTVTANDTYEVILNQTRTVREVNVRLGNEVSAGDVLFTLAGAGSEELDTARDALDALLLTYERKVIEASREGNYANDNRNIQRARNELTEAQDELADMPYSEEGIAAAQAVIDLALDDVDIAKAKISSAETSVANAEASIVQAEAVIVRAEDSVAAAQTVTAVRQAAVDVARNHLNELGGLNNVDVTSLNHQIAEINTKIASKRIERDAAWLVHKVNYEAFEKEADNLFNDTGIDWDKLTVAQKTTFMAAAAMTFPTTDPMIVAYRAITNLDNDLRDMNAERSRLEQDRNIILGSDNSSEYYRRLRILNDAEAILTTASAAESSANRVLAEANRLLAGANRVLADANRVLANTKTALTNAEMAVTEAEGKLGTQMGYKADWQAANLSIRNLQKTLEDLIFVLAEKQKDDGVTNALSALEMRVLRDDIDKKHQEISKLEEEGTGATVTSPVRGIVRQINISPGNQTQSGTPMAVIEVMDRGYFLRFTVTEAQARRVSIGDLAEVNRGYWWGGGEIRAVLTAIRNDPQNPATSRILEFDISGDVDSGENLSITLGQRSENYDVIVPNSAIRSDTNGDFVLVVLARSSPVGNRFIATRVDVNILASDDTSSAVTGGLSSWEFVITTSARPIEPGMQVRMVDNP